MNKNIIRLYYPYGIYVVSVKKEFYKVTCLGTDFYEIKDECGNKKEIPYDSKDYKPVLYPLESMKKKREVDGERIEPLQVITRIVYEYTKALTPGSEEKWIQQKIVNYFKNKENCPFPLEIMNYIYYILYSLHIDLSGSISQKEAKNVYRLQKNPYINGNL